MTAILTLTAIGLHARRALVEGARGAVVGVFEQSFHVVLDGHVVCVGGPALGNGPLNAITAEPPHTRWRDQGIVEDRACRCMGGVLAIDGGPTFSYAAANVWSPLPWPATWSPDKLRWTLEALAALAAPNMPRDGLAGVAFGGDGAPGLAGAAGRAALLHTATLSDWLASELEPSPAKRDAGLACVAREAVHELMGLGPGLTPAGDDVLAGLLVSLRAAGATGAADALAVMVRSAPADRTTALSSAFLEAAIDGIPGEAIAAMIHALLGNDHASLPACVEAIDAIGHTSGWDMLAGVVLGLAAITASRA